FRQSHVRIAQAPRPIQQPQRGLRSPIRRFLISRSPPASPAVVILSERGPQHAPPLRVLGSGSEGSLLLPLGSGPAVDTSGEECQRPALFLRNRAFAIPAGTRSRRISLRFSPLPCRSIVDT